MKVRDLLTDESKWTQRASARDIRGFNIQPRDERAVRWCVAGAMYCCYRDDEESAPWSKIDRYLELLEYSNIVGWNDDPKRTFLDIRDLVMTLDI